MRECKFLRENLIDFVEQKLDPESMMRLTGHLESCRGCRELAQGFRSIWVSADSLEDVEPSADLWARLQTGLDAVDDRREKRPVLVRFLPILRPAAMFAALIVAVVLGYGFGSVPAPSSTAETSDTVELWNEYHLESFDEFPDGSIVDLYFELADNGGDES